MDVQGQEDSSQPSLVCCPERASDCPDDVVAVGRKRKRLKDGKRDREKKRLLSDGRAHSAPRTLLLFDLHGKFWDGAGGEAGVGNARAWIRQARS